MIRPDRQQRSQIDWQAIGKRLTEAAVATQEALQPSPQRAKRILDQRAGILARPSVDSHLARNTADVISFALGGERYCIETRCVREVRRFAEATSKLLLSIQDDPGFPPAFRCLAACYAHMGRLDEARDVVKRLRTITPQVMPNDLPFRNPEDRELFLSGLRLAAGETS